MGSILNIHRSACKRMNTVLLSIFKQTDVRVILLDFYGIIQLYLALPQMLVRQRVSGKILVLSYTDLRRCGRQKLHPSLPTSCQQPTQNTGYFILIVVDGCLVL